MTKNRPLKLKDLVIWGPFKGQVSIVRNEIATVSLRGAQGCIECTLNGRVIGPHCPSYDGSVHKRERKVKHDK